MKDVIKDELYAISSPPPKNSKAVCLVYAKQHTKLVTVYNSHMSWSSVIEKELRL